MATSSSRLSIILLLILLLSSSSSVSSACSSYRSLLAIQRDNRNNQILNCNKMASRSQCSLNPKCRWCRSDALDDMCFSKAEAWRLPQQVFTCDS